MNSDLRLLFSEEELKSAFNCKEETLRIYDQRFNTIHSILRGKQMEVTGKDRAGAFPIWAMYRYPLSIVKLFNEAEKKKGELYSENTKKNWYDLLLRIRESYCRKFRDVGEKLLEKTAEAERLFAEEKTRLEALYVNRERGNEITVDDIRSGLDLLPTGSKEKILLWMYLEVPVRDDLQLKLVSNASQCTEQDVNYIYMDKEEKTFKVYIQKSKNVGHMKAQKPRIYTLSRQLAIEFFHFLRNVKDRRYPLGKTKLYKQVGETLKKLGLKKGIGSVNAIRHAVADEARKKGNEGEVAYKMCHTALTSVVYESNI